MIGSNNKPDIGKHEELLLKFRETQDINARDLLVQMLQGYVKSNVNRYFIAGMEYDDLVQLGNIALLKALDDYNFSIPLLSFISMAINRYLITQLESAKRLKRVINKTAYSLDAPLKGGQDERHLGDVLPDNALVQPLEFLIDKETVEQMKDRIVPLLSRLEKQVFNLYLTGDYSYVEIANLTNSNKKTIDNALSRIKNKVAQLNEKDEIKDNNDINGEGFYFYFLDPDKCNPIRDVLQLKFNVASKLLTLHFAGWTEGDIAHKTGLPVEVIVKKLRNCREYVRKNYGRDYFINRSTELTNMENQVYQLYIKGVDVPTICRKLGLEWQMVINMSYRIRKKLTRQSAACPDQVQPVKVCDVPEEVVIPVHLKKVMTLYAQGYDNDEIARKLCISNGTVVNYLKMLRQIIDPNQTDIFDPKKRDSSQRMRLINKYGFFSLEKLRPRLSKIQFKLFGIYLKGYSPKEIAAECNMQEGTVRYHIFTCRSVVKSNTSVKDVSFTAERRKTKYRMFYEMYQDGQLTGKAKDLANLFFKGYSYKECAKKADMVAATAKHWFNKLIKGIVPHTVKPVKPVRDHVSERIEKFRTEHYTTLLEHKLTAFQRDSVTLYLKGWTIAGISRQLKKDMSSVRNILVRLFEKFGYSEFFEQEKALEHNENKLFFQSVFKHRGLFNEKQLTAVTLLLEDKTLQEIGVVLGIKNPSWLFTDIKEKLDNLDTNLMRLEVEKRRSEEYGIVYAFVVSRPNDFSDKQVEMAEMCLNNYKLEEIGKSFDMNHEQTLRAFSHIRERAKKIRLALAKIPKKP